MAGVGAGAGRLGGAGRVTAWRRGRLPSRGVHVIRGDGEAKGNDTVATGAARGHGCGTGWGRPSYTKGTPALSPCLAVPHVKAHRNVGRPRRCSRQRRRGAHGLSRHTGSGLWHDAALQKYSCRAPEVTRPARPRGLQILAVMGESTRCPHSFLRQQQQQRRTGPAGRVERDYWDVELSKVHGSDSLPGP